ncbi:MAG: PAS domain S-box protein [Planctomycetales bacterium]|nr:PAS domain S-box protein [Planctomycetales bacterium]MCA9169785.1 PAS domain S-box protein [Planctomycetales bacterium]
MPDSQAGVGGDSLESSVGHVDATPLRSLAQLGLFDWDLDANRLTWSDELYRIYGYQPGGLSLSLDSFMSHVHPDDRTRVREAVAQTLHGEGAFHHLERICRCDGEWRVVESRGRLVTDSEGNGKRLIGACMDVTDLERSDLLLRTILASIPDAIIVVDVQGEIVLANPATSTMLQIQTDCVGQIADQVLPCLRVFRDYTGAWPTALDDMSAMGRLPHELAIVRADGSEFPAEITIHKMACEQCNLNVIVVRDVSESKTLREQLAFAQRMEAIGRLAGGIAHDFNNLLTVIVGSNDLVLLQTPPDSPIHEHALAIQDAAKRAANLTKQLVAFSRRQVMNAQVLDTNELIRGAQLLFSRVLGNDINFQCDLSEDLQPIEADPGQLEQVLLNLIINARDAMPRGGTMSLSARNCPGVPGDPQRSWVELRLTDTGTGIAAEVLPRIFEPFFSTKDASQGSGLGLAVAHGIIEQMGGRIYVDSAPGEGTTMRILLPVTRNADRSPICDMPTIRGGHETILVVDEDEAVRSIVRRALAVHGYHVLSAAGPREALDIARELSTKIELLVTDAILPSMTGEQLAAILRGTIPDLCVIYMSGNAPLPPLENESSTDKDMFLSKPFFPADLAHAVREHLDRREPKP